jgi:NTE family protein
MPVNLVFQGGGVRGIAYAGALESLPDSVRIDGVAGTSAGSIVAALLSIGKPKAEIRSILQDPELFSLLHAGDVERYQRIRAAIGILKPVFDGAISGKDPSVIQLYRLRRAFREVKSDLDAVWKSRGLHGSAKLGTWLGRIPEGKTFHDVKVSELKIVAADVSRQKYKVYSRKDGPMPLANAVHASASVPIFFDPYIQGADLYVDGGILSNFPAFLFADSVYPTIGFRLRDLLPPPGITSTLSYLKALLQTMVEAHDKERQLPRHYFQYDIVTPPDIGFDKFALTQTDVAELLNAGRQVGKTVPWQEHKQKQRRVSISDPNPEETLDFSISQAQRLLDIYSGENLWVDELTQHAEFVVRIGEDWSATYDRYVTFTVAGDKPLILQRFRVGGVLQEGNKAMSLMDLESTCEEVLPGGAKAPLIRIPAWDSDRQKGFLLFYDPPVTAQNSPRKFHTMFRIPKEFESVAAGEQGPISYGTQPLARKHLLKLTLRVLAHASLPRLVFSSDFGKVPLLAQPVNEGGTVYTEYRVDVPERPLGGVTVFTLQFRLEHTPFTW